MTTMTGSSLEHEIGAEGLLALRLRDGEVRLRGVDGETARVRDVNDHDLRDMFAIESATGSLSLKAGRGLEIVVGSRSMRRGFGQHAPELDIELPRHATLVLETASGDVDADGLIGDQRYRTASGDIVLRAVSGKLSIEAVSGDIDAVATGDADVVIRSVSGDIELRAARLSSLQLVSTSGDLKVAGELAGAGPFAIETVSGDGLLAPAGDVRIEMTSLTGDLTSDLEGQHRTEGGRRTFQVGGSGPVVTFRSMSGDLHVARSTLIGHAASLAPPAPPAPPAPQARLAPPAPPAQTAPPATPNGAIAAAYEDARLRILRSLERGEIDVAEAARRLETLDAGDVGSHPTAGDFTTADAGGEHRANG
jgi:hypothetical protein